MNENKTIGLGPHGTYTSEAMKKANEMYYRGEGELIYVQSNADAIRELREGNLNLQDGQIDRSTTILVPTYNDKSGNVVLRQDKEIGYTQEVLDEYRSIQGMYIGGQVDIIVAQTLGYSGEITDLRTVMSNKNALNQSEEAIIKLNEDLVAKGLPGLEIIECGSTAESLQLALQNKEIAGIGSPNTVLELNLKTLKNHDGTVKRLTDETITHMNLIHPAGNNLTINRLKEWNLGLDKLNTVMIEANVPNYEYSMYDVMAILKDSRSDMRALSIKPNGTAAVTMLMDVRQIDDSGILGLLNNLQNWETKKGGRIIVKGAYNSSKWKIKS
jgi:prephenate dehydratase